MWPVMVIDQWFILVNLTSLISPLGLTSALQQVLAFCTQGLLSLLSHDHAILPVEHYPQLSPWLNISKTDLNLTEQYLTCPPGILARGCIKLDITNIPILSLNDPTENPHILLWIFSGCKLKWLLHTKKQQNWDWSKPYHILNLQSKVWIGMRWPIPLARAYTPWVESDRKGRDLCTQTK